MKGKCKYDKDSMQLVVSSWQKKLFTVYCLLFTVFVSSCVESPNSETSNIKPETEIYYCPMHPDVVSNKPGKCPKPECKGMDLVLKTNDTLLQRVLKPVNNSVLASVKTMKPVFKKMNLDIEADGYIDYDSRTNRSISSLYSGRIEKLHLRYNYQLVHKGQKVFEIYSPELVTAQENLVYILNNSAGETTLVESAKQKLKLLGFSDALLNNLIQTKKVLMAVPVFSNYEGLVYEVMEKQKSSGGMFSSMNSENKKDFNSNSQIAVKEGQYVMMGETIFDVIDISRVAVIIQIKQEDIFKVSTGQKTEIRFDNDTTAVKGKIDFIEPMFKDGKKSLSARVYIENAKRNHKINSLVRAKIKGEEFEALWVPLSAVMDLGKEKKVWLKKDDIFIAKKVEIGARTEGMIEISDGLTEESEIAIEAHYLTDSEGFIKTNEDEQ